MNPYLRNIRVYQKALGILYLQPYYLFKLLVSPQFTESDKVIALLQDLYINSSASPLKSISYLISLTLKLIEHESLQIISSGFRPRMIRSSFLRLYTMVNAVSAPIKKFQEKIKRAVIEFIIKFCAEFERKEREQKNERKKAGAGRMESMKEISATDSTPPIPKGVVIQDRHNIKTKQLRSCFTATLYLRSDLEKNSLIS